MRHLIALAALSLLVAACPKGEDKPAEAPAAPAAAPAAEAKPAETKPAEADMHAGHDHGAAPHAEAAAGDTAPAFPAALVGTTVHDPVCNMDFKVAASTLFTKHEAGHTFFCNAGCKAKYDADPAAYAKK